METFMSFADQVVWVTGSSTGIGRAAALAFAAHGADVVVHGNENREAARALAREIEGMGRRSLAVLGDVADRHEVEAMVAQVQDSFGRLDVLVNNAGALIRRARLEALEEDLWDRVMDVNLKSVYLVTRAVLPLLKESRGRVINVTSVAARNGGGPGSIAYATAKAGVSNLTRALAKDLAEYGILVNAIAPGVIDTPFHERFTPRDAYEAMIRQIPLGRAGTPEESVGAILFLASPYARYITGEIIEVNGGQLMS